MIKFYSKTFSSDDGYTLVETIVALALLVSVLVPTGAILTKTMLSRRSADLIAASQLARMTMERTIINGNYSNESQEVILNKKTWYVSREVRNEMGLVTLQVRVFRKNQVNPVLTLKTLRQVAW